MSVYGEFRAATITAGATSSAAIDLGRPYDYLSVILPSMTACKLRLQVSETVGGTYYDLGKDVSTDEETYGRADVWRLGGYQFVKVVSSRTQVTSTLIRVRGMRY